jgi:lambda repressor-like predicted transcriptional regulator
MAELARQYGVQQQTVSEVLRRNGIPIRQQRAISKEEIAQAAELYSAGHSLASVGRQLGYDAETIRRHLRRQGVALRPRSTRHP